MYFTLLFILIFMVYIKGAWKQWEIHLPTLLYACTMNLFGYVIMGKDRLWYHIPAPLWKDITDTFILLPSALLLYLSSFPGEPKRKWNYYFKWAIASLVIEGVMIKTGDFGFSKNYRYWMDIPFYLIMYAFIWLHTKRPLLTYGLSILFIAFLIGYFDYSLGKAYLER